MHGLTEARITWNEKSAPDRRVEAAQRHVKLHRR
jgi:hypothetical protein